MTCNILKLSNFVTTQITKIWKFREVKLFWLVLSRNSVPNVFKFIFLDSRNNYKKMSFYCLYQYHNLERVIPTPLHHYKKFHFLSKVWQQTYLCPEQKKCLQILMGLLPNSHISGSIYCRMAINPAVHTAE